MLDEHGFFVDMRLDQSLSILTFKEIEQDMKALQKITIGSVRKLFRSRKRKRFSKTTIYN